ncbi:MAG TPA: hypothetical protein DHV52_03760 [Parachlamydiales bacterium]|nr:hypothetical protein [Parachlamydiales bacterium]
MLEKGWIALDIDGTTTAHVREIPWEVSQFLKGLARKGWRIFFITGRVYSWTLQSLSPLSFPYLFAVQNGADIIEMPAHRLLSRAYLSPKIIPFLEKAYRNIAYDYLIYAGFEKGDFCYYRPRRFPEEIAWYLDLLKSFSPAPWQKREEFSFAEGDSFPLIKCFGSKEAMTPLFEALLHLRELTVSMIRDPLCERFYLLLITDRKASKGTALDRARAAFHSTAPLIAAGDDFNDLPMLEKADIKIVMQTAPEEVKARADILAPSASECGIIPALKEALQRL